MFEIKSIIYHFDFFFILQYYGCLSFLFFLFFFLIIIATTLTDARLCINITDQAAKSFFSREAERSCKTGDHMLAGCMI